MKKNKEIIKFEKKRESLAELKSYQTTIVHKLTALKDLTKDFSKKKITEDEYKQLTKHKIYFLEDILSKAYTLHNKQLDFYVLGLDVLYQNIENTFKKTLRNDEYNISEKIDYIIKDYDYLIGKSKELSKKIIKIAPIASCLLGICLLFGILATFYGNVIYDLFAFHSKPFYCFQVFQR